MSNRTKLLAIGGGIGALLLAGGAFFLLSGRSPGETLEEIPGFGGAFDETVCPLSGEKPAKEELVDRPAVAVKIENNAVAYPLSGLEDAEIVYEELVEGGITRFMAMYHCTDTSKAGPVRSARVVDAAIMTPTTRILADAGGNDIVLEELAKADIISIDESAAGDAMRREERPGISSEHTLYGDTRALRKIGEKDFDEPPPDDMFEFGDLEGDAQKVKGVTIEFSAAAVITYEWSGDAWLRFDGGEPLVNEDGDQIEVDNVIIEEHEVNNSEIKDIAGNPSTEIADVTGTGRAVLLRDGQAIKGRWVRDSEDEAVRFETEDGDEMVLAPGTTWIELVPSKAGELKGSFSLDR